MGNHGTDPRVRMAVMRERIEAMKAIWTQDEASYAGEHVNFERIWSYPKPAQRPHPPILVGGDGPTVLDRVLAFGDAWFPELRRGARVSSGSTSCAPAPSARSTCSLSACRPSPRRSSAPPGRRLARRPLDPIRRRGPSKPASSAGSARSPTSTASDADRRRLSGQPLAQLADRNRGNLRMGARAGVEAILRVGARIA